MLRAGEFFRAASRLPIASLAEITLGRGIVVIAPHPDDESLGCGGLIAACCAADLPVRLIIVSDGVGSHPNSRSHPPSRLRELRERETRDAAAALGLTPESIVFLRLPDRNVPVIGRDAATARQTIRTAVETIGAASIFVTWPHDPHCDHQATATLTDAAILDRTDVRRFWYPVWGWTLDDDIEVGVPHGVRFVVAPHEYAKQAAIAAHRSQTTDLIDDDPDGFRLTTGMLAHFAGPYEVFLRA